MRRNANTRIEKPENVITEHDLAAMQESGSAITKVKGVALNKVDTAADIYEAENGNLLVVLRGCEWSEKLQGELNIALARAVEAKARKARKTRRQSPPILPVASGDAQR